MPAASIAHRVIGGERRDDSARGRCRTTPDVPPKDEARRIASNPSPSCQPGVRPLFYCPNSLGRAARPRNLSAPGSNLQRCNALKRRMSNRMACHAHHGQWGKRYSAPAGRNPISEPTKAAPKDTRVLARLVARFQPGQVSEGI